MNSPDPDSPISTDSSDSPPPDDFQFVASGPSARDPHTSFLHSATTQILGNLSSVMPSPGSKRRLPGGSSFDGPSRRDPKTRRREDAMSMGGNSRRMAEGQNQNAGGSNIGITANNAWGAKSEHGNRRDKEDLVDVLMAEQLRKEFGDPFLETAIKSLS
ncbi:uncharacterized protein F5891DRAFT_471556 [Suillus fuscotomentosus]|uniref:Uncharacterized protein n=1 Tax=Suillus fuscotomentosus TaxID=1912939 RepID=A0AAD4HRX6_9AGAM|nr:uncharacterized protein F5891DRAFT_316129 [Suillus fuscotomentosus]XP_041232112.1 uncharacterized protein F5891DRAFT_471556 [Suillus fuscotomentosus]KAG1900471.1 hypothetical protein F5891DRAFT_316129 [Suillus fuscotomentosus]KAG1906537.1 hypothetical protein F5891DRAFT_471556 [Suillus fuscotomentosus]